jgi:hypothetical protein
MSHFYLGTNFESGDSRGAGYDKTYGGDGGRTGGSSNAGNKRVNSDRTQRHQTCDNFAGEKTCEFYTKNNLLITAKGNAVLAPMISAFNIEKITTWLLDSSGNVIPKWCNKGVPCAQLPPVGSIVWQQNVIKRIIPLPSSCKANGCRVLLNITQPVVSDNQPNVYVIIETQP